MDRFRLYLFFESIWHSIKESEFFKAFQCLTIRLLGFLIISTLFIRLDLFWQTYFLSKFQQFQRIHFPMEAFSQFTLFIHDSCRRYDTGYRLAIFIYHALAHTHILQWQFWHCMHGSSCQNGKGRQKNSFQHRYTFSDGLNSIFEIFTQVNRTDLFIVDQVVRLA